MSTSRPEEYRPAPSLSDAVLEIIGCLVVVLDREGKILKINRACRQIIGHTAEGAVGRAFWDVFLPPEEVDGDRELFERLVSSSGGPTLDATHWRIRNGHDRQIAWSNATVTDGRGGVAYVIATGIDVTDLKRVEQELREARDAVQAASQAKDRFLAVLSHELRTPLTPVLIAVTSMLEDGLEPAAPRPALEMIRRNIELEARLIDDLLDVATIVRGGMRLDPRVIDLHEAVREGVEICGDDTRRAGLGVATELAASRHHVLADRARVLQIVWNLIRNASRFRGPAPRTLTIRTTNPDPGAAPGAASGPLPRPAIVVEFTDNGMGIDPAEIHRIFEPFEQGDSAEKRGRGGLGLGLAIGRASAEAQGGRLSATSPGRGRGATFRLQLDTVPAPPAPAPAVDRSPVTPAAAAVTGLRVLLVEDNTDTARYLAEGLRRLGLEVVTAEFVSTARDAVARAEAPFALLLSDIELPDGSGLDLMRDLGGGGRMPGLAMSGYGSKEDVQESLDAGFAEHLTKPLDTRRLIDAIQRVTVPT